MKIQPTFEMKDITGPGVRELLPPNPMCPFDDLVIAHWGLLPLDKHAGAETFDIAVTGRVFQVQHKGEDIWVCDVTFTHLDAPWRAAWRLFRCNFPGGKPSLDQIEELKARLKQELVG